MKATSFVLTLLLLGTGLARAQWGGLIDKSTDLMTHTFSFGGSNPEYENENYYDGDMGDLDGDGLPDRILGSRFGMLFNTGGGFMKKARRYFNFLFTPDPMAGSWGDDAVQLADLDGDGDLDAIVGGNFEDLAAQFNQEGRFSTAWELSGNSFSALNIVNTDLERDGDVDLIVASAFCSDRDCGGPVHFSVLVNDGTGVMTPSSSQASQRGLAFGPTDYITGVVSGDIDGDGDFDLVIAHGASGKIVIAKNDGRGNFTLHTTQLAVPCSGFGQGMNLGDIDNDGDLDLVIGRCSEDSSPHPIVTAVIGINDGTGNFTDVSATRWDAAGLTTKVGTENAKLVDIDYDGDLDFIAFDGNPGRGVFHLQVYLNDGTGRFRYSAAHSRQFLGFPGTASALGADVDITDLNGDGSYDVWVGQGGDNVRILLNTHADPSGLPADVPRNLRVVSADGAGVTLKWQAPPFAATARYYRVYRALAPGLEDRDRPLLRNVALSVHQDEGFSAPITRFTTAAQLNDPDVTLLGSTNEIQLIDRTAKPGVAYYYTVAHVGTENTMSRQTAEVRAQIPAASGRDTTPPELAIVSPTRQHWSQHPRIVVAFADGESGIDPNSLHVSFDQPLGGGARAAGANVADLGYRRDANAFIAFLKAPLSLPKDTLVTMTARVSDVAGNQATKTVQFFPSVASASPPTASFAATPTAGAAPLRVAFDADASTDADGAVVRWEWTFGDGSTGLGRKVSKTYAFGGSYAVTLVVRDNEGGVGTMSRTITVSGSPAPDGGATPADAGSPPADGGALTSDAGAALDVGSLTGDAGTSGQALVSAPTFDKQGCGGCAASGSVGASGFAVFLLPVLFLIGLSRRVRLPRSLV